MKKIFVLLFLSITAASFAERRTMQEVMDIAQPYLSSTATKRCIPSRELLSSSSTIVQQHDAFYMITADAKKGFVIVSADTRMPRVMGYSDEPLSDTLPPSLLWLMQIWNQSYHDMLTGQLTPEDAFPQAVLQTAQDSVGPLLGDIKFGQTYPYNKKCPNNSVTGCVATAMAQIMCYYRYPSVGTGTFHYAGPSGVFDVDISKTPFDWNNILHDYRRNSYTTAQADAVATLMLACGVSVNMNYDTGGSGAYSKEVRGALVNNFYYHSDARYLEANPQPNYEDWLWAMAENFDAGRPIYYSGTSVETGGHAFVLDGYHGDYKNGGVRDVLVHVNWGWDGSSNGWYYLDVLDPSGNKRGYIYDNGMVFDIYPAKTPVDNIPAETAPTLSLDQPIYNLLGQKVAPEHLQKGVIYLQAGKKVILQ